MKEIKQVTVVDYAWRRRQEPEQRAQCVVRDPLRDVKLLRITVVSEMTDSVIINTIINKQELKVERKVL